MSGVYVDEKRDSVLLRDKVNDPAMRGKSGLISDCEHAGIRLTLKLINLSLRLRGADEENVAFAHVLEILTGHDDDSFVGDGMTQQSFFEPFAITFAPQHGELAGDERIFRGSPRPFGEFREAKQVLRFQAKIAATVLLGNAGASAKGQEARQYHKNVRAVHNSHHHD